ncbi:MAG: murein L,D-transpeptidase [Alphaproteobacteria bacterium]|nr:murein L,D-transpeptidase [Alphaproteobacteria bacterium]
MAQSKSTWKHQIAAGLKTAVLMSAAVLLIAGAAFIEHNGATLFGKRISGLISSNDNRSLAFQRAWRLAYWSIGWQLPGTPDLGSLDGRLKSAGFSSGAPIFIRIFKREFILEVWLKRGDKFERFASYPICRFSGRLGPKLKQGDRQAPEGIYTVSKSQLNPASRWHRSFNLGFPNTFDRWHRRTGSFLMVHGGCSSIGCYAVTNDAVDEIWKLVTASLNAGQKRFQVQVFPFRMTAANLADQTGHRWHGFWKQLKPAHDLFEQTRLPPKVEVCARRYVAAPGAPGSNGSRLVKRSCKLRKSIATN